MTRRTNIGGQNRMSNTDEIRWQQRLDNFSKALSQLDDACERDSYTDLERAGLVQIFEFSFELAWKVLKDLLFYEGYDLITPREVIRKSFEVNYIVEDDCEIFLDALKKRNLLSHTYNEELALQSEALIRCQYHPMLLRLHITLEKRRAL